MNDRVLIGSTCAMMALGLGGTLMVMAGVLPTPSLAAPRADATVFANHFVGKDQLLTAYQWIRLNALHTAPPSVIIGRRGWLYYRSEAAGDGGTISDFMGLYTPDLPTLEFWKQKLVDRRLALESRNIRYLAFVAPNPSSVYPEYLPDEILKARGRTRMDKIAAVMPNEVMDLRPVLLDARARENVFDRSDTHWNDLGAFAAYSAISARLTNWFPDIAPLQRSDFIARPLPRTGEVENLIGPWVGRPHPSVYLDPLKPYSAHCAETDARVLVPGAMRDPDQPRAGPNNWAPRNWIWTNGLCPSRRFVQKDPALPKAVIFHDSFMIALNPFLSQNFREVLYVRGGFNATVVDREKPDVVIQAVAERYVDGMF